MNLFKSRVYLGRRCTRCSLFNVNYPVVCDIDYKSGRPKVCVNAVYLCGFCVHLNNVALCGNTARNVALDWLATPY